MKPKQAGKKPRGGAKKGNKDSSSPPERTSDSVQMIKKLQVKENVFSQLTTLLQNAAQESDYDQWKAKLVELEKTKQKNLQLQEALNSCEEQISSMSTSNSSLEKALAGKKAEAEELKEKLDVEQEEAETLRFEAQQLKECSDLVGEYRDTNSDLKSKCRTQEKELCRLTETLEVEQQKNVSLQQELREAKEGWAAEMKEMSAVIQELREEAWRNHEANKMRELQAERQKFMAETPLPSAARGPAPALGDGGGVSKEVADEVSAIMAESLALAPAVDELVSLCAAAAANPVSKVGAAKGARAERERDQQGKRVCQLIEAHVQSLQGLNTKVGASATTGSEHAQESQQREQRRRRRKAPLNAVPSALASSISAPALPLSSKADGSKDRRGGKSRGGVSAKGSKAKGNSSAKGGSSSGGSSGRVRSSGSKVGSSSSSSSSSSSGPDRSSSRARRSGSAHKRAGAPSHGVQGMDTAALVAAVGMDGKNSSSSDSAAGPSADELLMLGDHEDDVVEEHVQGGEAGSDEEGEDEAYSEFGDSEIESDTDEEGQGQT